MTEHTCENCYYRYFDSKAYPCSMCVCGEERKDMFKAKRGYIGIYTPTNKEILDAIDQAERRE